MTESIESLHSILRRARRYVITMRILRSIWPCLLCAALLGTPVVTGCLDEPIDEASAPPEVTEVTSEQVCGPVCGVCGNGICEVGELRFCPRDCMLSQCGNGLCDATETALSCPLDCPSSSGMCGDGVCNLSELTTCPADCGVATTCGNGTCDALETPLSCPADCRLTMTCGNGTCDLLETPLSCPADCP